MKSAIFEVKIYGDCEGRSYKTVGYFTDKDLAKAICVAFGGDGPLSRHGAHFKEHIAYSDAASFYTDNTAFDPSDYPNQDELEHVVKLRALAKLTPEERKALGV